VTLVAAIVQGTIGFGFTLLAVSFFLLIVQSGDAIQLLIVDERAFRAAVLTLVGATGAYVLVEALLL
jgi:hypothetical protein